MKFIIVGVGKVGETLVKNLIVEGHEIIVIDKQAERIDSVVSRYDVKGITGLGLEREALLEAGVSSADYFIACTSFDEVNILSCVLAKKLGAKITIARVRDPKYNSELESLKKNLGLDLVFNPEKRAAEDIEQILKFPSAKSVETFANGRAVMVNFSIQLGNPICGKSLMKIVKEYSLPVLFATIKRKDEIIIPRGDFVINENDEVNVIASENVLTEFCKRTKIFKPRAKSVFIVGGGKVAFYLAENLIESGVTVKIVEKSEERCKFLADELPKATVICGDASEQEVLDEENLKDSDACVCLTGMDEENVIISLYAKQNNIDKVIAKVARPSILKMVKQLGLDSVVSPRNSIANHILRFVRANQSITKDEGIKTYYKIYDNVEAVEFTVNDNFSYTGVQLKNLKLKENILIGGIVRCGEFILPTGFSTLEKDDKVIIISAKNIITKLSEIIR